MIVRSRGAFRGAVVRTRGRRRQGCACELGGTLIEIPASESCGGVLEEGQQWPPFVVDVPYCLPSLNGGIAFYEAEGSAAWGYFARAYPPASTAVMNAIAGVPQWLSATPTRINSVVPAMSGVAGLVTTGGSPALVAVADCSRATDFSLRGLLELTHTGVPEQRFVRIGLHGNDGIGPSFGPYQMLFTACVLGHELPLVEWQAGEPIEDLAGWQTVAPGTVAREQQTNGSLRLGLCSSAAVSLGSDFVVPHAAPPSVRGNWCVPIARLAGARGRTVRVVAAGSRSLPTQGHGAAHYLCWHVVRMSGGTAAGEALLAGGATPQTCGTTAYGATVNLVLPNTDAGDDVVLFARVLHQTSFLEGVVNGATWRWQGCPPQTLTVQEVTVL